MSNYQTNYTRDADAWVIDCSFPGQSGIGCSFGHHKKHRTMNSTHADLDEGKQISCVDLNRYNVMIEQYSKYPLEIWEVCNMKEAAYRNMTEQKAISVVCGCEAITALTEVIPLCNSQKTRYMHNSGRVHIVMKRAECSC